MAVLDKLVDAASAVGSKMAAAPDDDRTAAGIKAKAANVKDYMDAVAQKPVTPKTPAAGTNVDKINKNAKYGDRPGEKRLNVSDMTKPLASFKKGTTSVPKTGPAIVHKGEAVIPAKENSMSDGLYDKVPGMPAHKPKKEIDHIRTSKAKSGGYIHEHHHTAPEHHPKETHVSATKKDMLAHMAQHMGDPETGADTAAPDAAAGAPPMGGPAAGAPPPGAAPAGPGM
jgi:hypothetical protein